jgi:alkanesulfonate monooxygenase SsuD/methylene tetrahydromethanopterin reductase-like flavin-dependent oxidoreductase (luciferase family)
VPIIVGGHSDIALRRAAQRGDGWVGVYYTREELRAYTARLDRLRAEAGRLDQPFEVIAAVTDALPHAGVVEQLEGMGVTTLMTSAWMIQGLTNASLDDNKRALDDFATTYIEPLR